VCACLQCLLKGVFDVNGALLLMCEKPGHLPNTSYTAPFPSKSHACTPHALHARRMGQMPRHWPCDGVPALFAQQRSARHQR
jgi:hypothetical protein